MSRLAVLPVVLGRATCDLPAVMPPRSDERESGLSKREAKGLSYKAEVPAFLQQLHAQVHGRAKPVGEPRVHDDDGEDPVLAFLGATPTGEERGKPRPERDTAPRGDGYDSDNDLEHAQIVVLKEGKHLTKEDYLQETAKRPVAQSAAEQVAEPGAMQPKKSDKAGQPRKQAMGSAKELIHAHRTRKRSQDQDKPAERRRRKNLKPGVGLSFDVDEA